MNVLVPSSDEKRDAAQWPEADALGVRFVPDYFPGWTRYWISVQRMPVRALKRAGWPFPMPLWLRRQLADVDAVLSVGGDNYSLDYKLPSLFMGLDGFALELNKPVVLWGASVGPFDREPAFVPVITEHLARMAFVAVRETSSQTYLADQLHLQNVVRMADPAFTLEPEPLETESFWPADDGGGVLGFNVSPLIERYRADGQDLRAEAIAFVRHAVVDRGLSVLLVPHVLPVDGEYMKEIAAALGDLGPRVRMMPEDLNASQTKTVIARCRFFIGARTHATIAALSSCVPTVSIAYSVKAKGINLDLFGDCEAVLETTAVSSEALSAKLEWLIHHESHLREVLHAAVPVARDRAAEATRRVGTLI